jgi:hypothetical protein
MPPDWETHECPEGTRLCGLYGRWINEFCIKKEVRCPINDLKLVARTQEIDESIKKQGNQIPLKTDQDWNYVIFDD